MLLEEYKKWNKPENMSDEDAFGIFYQEHTVGKGWMLIMCDLAYQIHNLQVCVEGLIEDLEPTGV